MKLLFENWRKHLSEIDEAAKKLRSSAETGLTWDIMNPRYYDPDEPKYEPTFTDIVGREDWQVGAPDDWTREEAKCRALYIHGFKYIIHLLEQSPIPSAHFEEVEEYVLSDARDIIPNVDELYAKHTSPNAKKEFLKEIALEFFVEEIIHQMKAKETGFDDYIRQMEDSLRKADLRAGSIWKAFRKCLIDGSKRHTPVFDESTPQAAGGTAAADTAFLDKTDIYLPLREVRKFSK